jgi:hypothetical protein
MESMPPATETGKENLNIISSLLGMIGFKNKSQGQKFVGDIRLRHYQAVPTGYKDELEEGEFDLIAAREDILAAIGKRFNAWMESEKAVINWEEIVNFEPVAVEENSGDLPVEAIVEELQSVTTKEHYEAVYLNVSQASMTAAWNALTQDIRDIITGLLNETQTNVCTIA